MPRFYVTAKDLNIQETVEAESVHFNADGAALLYSGPTKRDSNGTVTSHGKKLILAVSRYDMIRRLPDDEEEA